MSLVCALVVSIFASAIQQVQIVDRDISAALNAYLDSLNSKVGKPRITYNLMARVETSGSRKIVYVSSVYFTSVFWHNVPDKYSKLDNRLVFWYEKKGADNNENEREVYRKFCAQFYDDLIKDCSIDGVNDIGVQLSFADLESIGPFRITIGKNKKKVQSVCRFPDVQFYRSGYTFDDNGDLMFNGGAYDICSIDRPFRFTKEGYDPNDYVRRNCGLPYELFKKNDLSFYVTIGKNGKVIKAEIYPTEHIVSERDSRRIIETMLLMPRWNGATLHGRKVKYRLLIGL